MKIIIFIFLFTLPVFAVEKEDLQKMGKKMYEHAIYFEKVTNALKDDSSYVAQVLRGKVTTYEQFAKESAERLKYMLAMIYMGMKSHSDTTKFNYTLDKLVRLSEKANELPKIEARPEDNLQFIGFKTDLVLMKKLLKGMRR